MELIQAIHYSMFHLETVVGDKADPEVMLPEHCLIDLMLIVQLLIHLVGSTLSMETEAIGQITIHLIISSGTKEIERDLVVGFLLVSALYLIKHHLHVEIRQLLPTSARLQ